MEGHPVPLAVVKWLGCHVKIDNKGGFVGWEVDWWISGCGA